MAFDPDSYLSGSAKTKQSGFNPDAYLGLNTDNKTPVNDVPLLPGMQGYEQQKQYQAGSQSSQPEPTIMDKGAALLKAGAVMGANAIPATIGSIGGSIYGALSGQGPEEVARGAEQFSPFSTQDPLANEYIAKAGEALGALDPGYVGRVAMAATSPARIARDRATVQGAASAIPEAISAVKEIPNIGKTPLEIEQGKTNFVQSQLEAGKIDRNLAGKMIENGKVVSNPAAKQAIKQGFDEGLVSAIDNTSTKTKSNLLRMVRTSEQGKRDPRFGAENRPSDVIGDSLAERIKFFKDTNRKAGTEIDVAANSIKGKSVNYEAPLNTFENDIKAAGITISDNGQLNFKGSDLEFSPGDKRLISDIYSRARTINGQDAFKVHKLKRLIDRTVDYGKGSQKGITSGGESIVKNFRSAVDYELDNTFENYNIANTKYSDTISELKSFQNAVGPSIDIFGENADKALGTKSRTLLSNAQNRIRLMDSLKSIDDVAKKYGANFEDDIVTQVMFANALDKHFGTPAKTSLLGDVGTATASAVRGNTTEAGIGVLKAATNRLTGKSDEASYKALKELLMRKEKQ